MLSSMRTTAFSTSSVRRPRAYVHLVCTGLLCLLKTFSFNVRYIEICIKILFNKRNLNLQGL